MGNIPKEFRELFESLNAHNAEYAESVVAALSEFGFSHFNLTAADFQAPDRVLQFGVPPLHIDVLTSIDAVTRERVREHRNSLSADDTEIAIIGRDDLVLNKRAHARDGVPVDVAASK